MSDRPQTPPYTTFWPVRQHLCGADVILEAGSPRPFDAETGEYHSCDYAAALGRVPRLLRCICGAVVRDHPDGHRTDVDTDHPYTCPPPPQPEPLLQIEGPKQIEAPSERYENEL